MPTNTESVTATLTSKGQITLPVAMRRSLGVKVGDKITFSKAKDGSWMLPRQSESVFEKWRGIGTGIPIEGKGRKAIVMAVRKLRGHEDLIDDDID